MSRPLYLERSLFVIGPQDSGKSVQLRSMFADVRFGTRGSIPDSKNLRETICLSGERRLYIRLTSPHEFGESPKEFLEKIERKTGSGRWCFAGALQESPFQEMPGVLKSVEMFIERFDPERIRLFFLSPDRHGRPLSNFINVSDTVTALQRMSGIECMFIDARSRTANGLMLSDFFDFS